MGTFSHSCGKSCFLIFRPSVWTWTAFWPIECDRSHTTWLSKLDKNFWSFCPSLLECLSLGTEKNPTTLVPPCWGNFIMNKPHKRQKSDQPLALATLAILSWSTRCVSNKAMWHTQPKWSFAGLQCHLTAATGEM